MNYAELNQQLTGRNQQRRKYANNTYLERRGDDDIALLYHTTDVVTFKPNGDVVLNSGGWRTSTTKERINLALPNGYYLSQDKGVWYIVNRRNAESVVFADRITLKANGTITNAGKDNPKATRELKAKVKAFAKLCADAIPLDQPGNGDCWYCLMRTEGGQTLGDASKNTEHLDNHMSEGYVVPSLVANALKERYNAPMAFWTTFKDTGWTSDRDFGRQAVTRAVYRYILSRKGYAV